MVICFQSERCAGAPVPRTRITVLRCAVRRARMAGATAGYRLIMYTLLWIVAAVLVIAGIVGIVRGELIWGIALIVAGLLIGPGGVSILT